MIGDTYASRHQDHGGGIERLAHAAGEVADMVEGATTLEWSRTLADGTMERWEAEIHGRANDWSDVDLTCVRVLGYSLIDADGIDVAWASSDHSSRETLDMLAERCWDVIEDDDDLQRRIARDIWDRR